MDQKKTLKSFKPTAWWFDYEPILGVVRMVTRWCIKLSLDAEWSGKKSF